MIMFLFNVFILTFCIGVLEGAATIRDFIKDEGGGFHGQSRGTFTTEPMNSHSEKRIYYEYPLEKLDPGNEYLKISIFSRSKLSIPFPDPRNIWNKTVPYIIYKRSSSKEKKMISDVIDVFNRRTCLKFLKGMTDDIFISITPKNRLLHNLCRTKEKSRYQRKLIQGIFFDLKFSIDFGLSDEDTRKNIRNNTTVILTRLLDSSIQKLNEFYNCDAKVCFSNHNRDHQKRRKKRSQDIMGNEYSTSLSPDVTVGESSHSTKMDINEPRILLPGEGMYYDDDIDLTYDIPLVGKNQTIENKFGIPLPHEENKLKGVDQSISFRRNEKNASDDVVSTSTRVINGISTDIPISFPATQGKDVVLGHEDTTKENSINDVISTTIAAEQSASSKESPVSDHISSTITDVEHSTTIKEVSVSDPISSTSVSKGVTVTIHDNSKVTSENDSNLSTRAQTVNLPPSFRRRRDSMEINNKTDGHSASTVLRKPLLKGGKDFVLTKDKMYIIDDHSVNEHEIGSEHNHDEEHDGFHKVGIIDENPIQGRTALSNPAMLWTDGIIPYTLSEKYDARQKQLVIEGMEQFHNQTCVKFVKRTTEKSYMFFQPDTRCSATVGRVEGRANNVTISDGCFVPGIIVHELMHVMGFIHEQNRPDRDSYVMIVWGNIIPKTRGNFKRYRKGTVQDFGLGYDYDSVMHYGMYDFALNPDAPTIIPLKAGTHIGQRDGFSKKDLIKINKLFRCDEDAQDEDKGGGIEFRRRVVPDSIVPDSGSDFKKKFLKYLKKLFKALFVTMKKISLE